MVLTFRSVYGFIFFICCSECFYFALFLASCIVSRLKKPVGALYSAEKWCKDQDSLETGPRYCHAVSLFSDFVVEISTLSTKDQYGEVAGGGRPHSG